MAKPLNYKASEVLKHLTKHYDYDVSTGVIRRVLCSTKLREPLADGTLYMKVYGPAGSITEKGYCKLSFNINGKFKGFAVHRLAWLITYGKWPDGDLDHINHIKTDNRIANLREVSNLENSKNKPRRKDNKSGTTGVGWSNQSNRWMSSIRIDGHLKHLGTFIDYHEAVNTRKNAEVLYGFHENHGG